MKKLIRFLADISGVTNEIRCETFKEVGNSMEYLSSWFVGGLMYANPKPDVEKALLLYSEYLKNGCTGPSGESMHNYRDNIYKEK